MKEQRFFTGANEVNFKYEITKGFTSVILPVYQDVEGLEQTLDSLENQSIPHSEFEVIVSNDGGYQEITDVCKKYDVKELVVIPNSGSYYARNRALEESRGEILAFVDADVTVPENWLEQGRNELTSSDYVGGPVIIDKSKIKQPAHYYESLYGFPTDNFFYEQHFCVTANLFVKRFVIEELGGFDERLRSGGDNEFGKRVYISQKFKQNFSSGIPVYHPPRGFTKLVNKKVRLHRGRLKLNEFFPGRYNYTIPGSGGLIFSMLLPPKISSVDKIFKNNDQFSFLRKYFFIWKLKFFTNLNLYKLYYLSSRNDGI